MILIKVWSSVIHPRKVNVCYSWGRQRVWEVFGRADIRKPEHLSHENCQQHKDLRRGEESSVWLKWSKSVLLWFHVVVLMLVHQSLRSGFGPAYWAGDQSVTCPWHGPSPKISPLSLWMSLHWCRPTVKQNSNMCLTPPPLHHRLCAAA